MTETSGKANKTKQTAHDSALSRRRLLGTAGAVGAGGLLAGGVAGAAGATVARDGKAPLSGVGSASLPFHGTHQAGIADPAQAHGHLLAFDLAPGADRKAAAALLRRWSATAAELAAGRAPKGDDTGIALDAGPSSLTVTFGFGRTFFDRTGLTAKRPARLEPLPAFTQDALDPKHSDGDLWVQIGADDAFVAFHALRLIQRQAADSARLRWQMNGFNRAPGATEQPMTGRNLMGQIDGTNNPKPSAPDFDERIFVPGDHGGADAWMAGGSFAVVRRIRMLLDTWDHLSPERQERVIGRRKSDGAPLSGGTETTPVDLDKVNPDGTLAIAGDAHIRVAAPESNRGATMLRRAYSYHDGFRDDGAPDAGLLFIAWQADPMRGFVPVQRKLDRGDGLSRFLRHEASGLFAVPGGCAEGEYVGQRLLEG
ncbi:deferrochelatase/peroxidase EfeB [Streptomyces sp. AV19]|uniref:iron uptake transporter deferrochelatase/peroxidase subunit n=1 Tax=Streptomyces sp. AV19 TaxID=2793068 RepID=UPI0018FEA3B3|nr:iron uptake transporter deferrochelatase/peroxidase subunit [Streptomyces sp. AV19]MBH1934758.1 deferrochelatase/peroxidase EfeB [Streptomyces sp. AV19]MDG4530634.1 iron uptake transporter deferrochelatase/peroxidase subunit [Streptomyces sp. AV19]